MQVSSAEHRRRAAHYCNVKIWGVCRCTSPLATPPATSLLESQSNGERFCLHVKRNFRACAFAFGPVISKMGRAKDCGALKGAELFPPWRHDIMRRCSKCADMRSSVRAAIKKSSSRNKCNMGKKFWMMDNNLLLTWRPIFLIISKGGRPRIAGSSSSQYNQCVRIHTFIVQIIKTFWNILYSSNRNNFPSM